MIKYQGPASIAGVSFPSVSLREESVGHLRSWEGTTSFLPSAEPSGFTADLLNTSTTIVQLPDGRQGDVFVSTSFDGQRWTLDLTGTGPAPWMTE